MRAGGIRPAGRGDQRTRHDPKGLSSMSTAPSRPRRRRPGDYVVRIPSPPRVSGLPVREVQPVPVPCEPVAHRCDGLSATRIIRASSRELRTNCAHVRRESMFRRARIANAEAPRSLWRRGLPQHQLASAVRVGLSRQGRGHWFEPRIAHLSDAHRGNTRGNIHPVQSVQSVHETSQFGRSVRTWKHRTHWLAAALTGSDSSPLRSLRGDHVMPSKAPDSGCAALADALQPSMDPQTSRVVEQWASEKCKRPEADGRTSDRLRT